MTGHTSLRVSPNQGYPAHYGVVFKAGALAMAGITVIWLLRKGSTMLMQEQWVLFGCFFVGSMVGLLAILETFLHTSSFGTQGFRHRTMFGRTTSGSYKDVLRISYQPQRLTLFLKNGQTVKVFAQQGDLKEILNIIRESHISIPVRPLKKEEYIALENFARLEIPLGELRRCLAVR